jgi:putative transposase
MCRTLGVNRTSFHDWERRAPSDRALSDASLIERVKQVHAASGGTCGARLRPRRAAPRAPDRRRAKARRAADEGGWYLGRRAAQAPADDSPPARAARGVRMVERDLRPSGPNLTWSADITYISTWGRVSLLGARPGPVLQVDRRVVDGRPSALRARRRRARDGDLPTQTRPRARAP